VYCPYDVAPLASLSGARTGASDTPFGRVYWVVFGPLDGRPVTLLVHGVNDDADTWTPLLSAARASGADLGSLVAVDLPGFGRSRREQAPLDLTRVGDAVLDVAAGLGAGPLRVVGHSMGALLVADLALRHPERVASLHLVAGPYYSVLDGLHRRRGGWAARRALATYGVLYATARTGRLGARLTRQVLPTAVGRLLLRGFVARPGALRRSVLQHLADAQRPESFLGAARNGRRYREGLTLAGVRCPVWAVFGAADHLVPDVDARRLQDDLPHAQLTRVSAAGHLVHIERPAATWSGLGLR